MLKNIDLQKLLNLFVYDPSDPLVFSTTLFLFFFFIFLAIYYLLKSRSSRIYAVIIFSLFFYYKAAGFYFLLLVFTSVINYYAGNWIGNSQNQTKRKLVFIAALILNLGILAYFKYTNFFLQIVSDLHLGPARSLDIFLPIGISFFTFKALSYVIEIYFEITEPVKSFRDFSFFVVFFPNLLMGPIDRAAAFLPQVERENEVTQSMMGEALFLILCGLFKKVVIADYISLNFIDRVFEIPTRFTGVENLLAIYGYAIQIYCDFSGYTDMALGVALLMGFRLMDNFNRPFQASSVAEYWRRWHISLSTWLLDYLFKPLQMKLRNLRLFGSALALLITFVAVGLWHGPAWTFVLFGVLHSIFLIFSLFTQKYRKMFYDKVGLSGTRTLKFFQILFTFHLVVFSVVLFRASSFQLALDMYRQIFTYFHGEVFLQFVPSYMNVFGLMILGYLLHFTPKSWEFKTREMLTNTPLVAQALIFAIMIYVAAQVKSADLQPFLYFKY